MYSCKNPKSTLKVIDFKTYEPNWESLEGHPAPQWLMDAKFGIYAHWGVYSVPAYGFERYGSRMYETSTEFYKYHLKTYGDPSKFGYKDFAPMFKAEYYDPDKWAELIKVSGAKYAGLAVVHHDGFCLWDSRFTRWDVADMGPHRDLYGELVKALRKNDLKVIATFHHFNTFNYFLHYRNDPSDPYDPELRMQWIKKQYKDTKWDIYDPQYGDLYWNQGKKFNDFMIDWKNKVEEVIDNYQPDIIWFDGGDFQDTTSENTILETLEYYLNKEKKWNKPVEVLNKLPASLKQNFPKPFGTLTFEEGRDRDLNETSPWIDDMRIGNSSWGYVEGQSYKDANEIIDGLIDRVSRGGGLLLNLSPKADGTIPDIQVKVLTQMGNWLKINGEAIYGTHPWIIHSEGPEKKAISPGPHLKPSFKDCDSGDIRFTVNDNTLYAIALGWPENMQLIIKSINGQRKISSRGIANVSLVGSSKKVDWTLKEDGTHILLPEKLNDIALVLKFEVAGKLY